jgi:hypothetical protein
MVRDGQSILTQPIYESADRMYRFSRVSIPSIDRLQPPTEKYRIDIGRDGVSVDASPTLFPAGGPLVDCCQLEQMLRGQTVFFRAQDSDRPDHTNLIAAGAKIIESSVLRMDGSYREKASVWYMLAIPHIDQTNRCTAFTLPFPGEDKQPTYRFASCIDGVSFEVNDCYDLLKGKTLCRKGQNFRMTGAQVIDGYHRAAEVACTKLLPFGSALPSAKSRHNIARLAR